MNQDSFDDPGAEHANFLIYQANNGEVRVDVHLQDETLWLTQKSMAELFAVQRPAVTKHLKKIFESGELNEEVACSILELPTRFFYAGSAGILPANNEADNFFWKNKVKKKAPYNWKKRFKGRPGFLAFTMGLRDNAHPTLAGVNI